MLKYNKNNIPNSTNTIKEELSDKEKMFRIFKIV